MDYRQLGTSGVRVSTIGLGTNRFGSPSMTQEQVNDFIDAACDAGINFIDTANSYQGTRSEAVLGNALRGRWNRFVVATKFFFPTGNGTNDRGASRYHVISALEDSLLRLQSDHVDLYYVHRWDETAPIEETMRALDDLIRQGKMRYIGVSDFASWQLAYANLLGEMRGWTSFVVIQSRYNMLDRDVEREVLPYCRAHGVGFVPYYPLAGGFLTGKYKEGETAPPGSRGQSNSYVQQYMASPYYDVIRRLEVWARDHGRGLNELAQAWLLAQPRVCSVISGATRLEQMQSNVNAADWNLTPGDLEEIDKLIRAD
jgi:aryl-alcohol dehydrogenase-like predicted oxidoreductase